MVGRIERATVAELTAILERTRPKPVFGHTVPFAAREDLTMFIFYVRTAKQFDEHSHPDTDSSTWWQEAEERREKLQSRWGVVDEG